MNLMKYTMTAVVAGAMMMFSAADLSAQETYLNNQSQHALDFHLFQNFYTPQGPSAVTAEMYSAPHPVPYHVGGSHYTYQPFYPHEHLYAHRKNYYNYYGTSNQFYSDGLRHGQGGDALNKTTVIWKSTGYHFGNLPFSSYKAQKLKYNLHARKYGLNGGDRSFGGGFGRRVGHGANCGGGSCGNGCQ